VGKLVISPNVLRMVFGRENEGPAARCKKSLSEAYGAPVVEFEQGGVLLMVEQQEGILRERRGDRASHHQQTNPRTFQENPAAP